MAICGAENNKTNVDSALNVVQDMPQVRFMERLGRGVVAQRRKSDVFISWRILGTEDQNIAFNVYRAVSGGAKVKLNPTPLNGATCFVDAGANTAMDNAYSVATVINGVEQPDDNVPFVLKAGTAVEAPIEIPLYPRENYYVHLVWVGDLTGDGEYDFVVDRLPQDNPDPDATQKVEAYTRHGEHLWTIDMGPQSKRPENVPWNDGASMISNGHNDNLTVFDFTLNGRSEVAIQTAKGVVFGDGTVLEEGDYVRQFISLVDGKTGAEITRTPVPQDFAMYGPSGGHFGVAYLDGIRPSIIYKCKNRNLVTGAFYSMINAWTFETGELKHNWKFIPPRNASEYHQIRIADLDGDGRDEIIDGGYAVSPDGELFWILEDTVHGDRFFIGKLDKDRPGLQGFAVQQNHADFLKYFYYDAGTGEILRKHYGTGLVDVGRGMVADIDPNYPGYEYWAFDEVFNSATGEIVAESGPWPNFRIWWDGDPGGELLSRTTIDGWNYEKGSTSRQLTAYTHGATHCWRDAPVFYGDIMGDWREEVIYEHTNRDRLLIFTTPYSTDMRLYTLPHNPCYRACMTVKGYMQSHLVDYYLGYGMDDPPLPQIALTPLSEETPKIEVETPVFSWAAGNGIWDINSTANWIYNNTKTPYKEGSNIMARARLDDSCSGRSPVTVIFSQTPSPFSTLVTNDLKQYRLASGWHGLGGGSLTKAGTNILEISTPCSYSRETCIEGGTIRLGASNVIPYGAGKGNIVLNGMLDLNGFSQTINGLSGFGIIDSHAPGTSALTVGVNDKTSVFLGTISNTVGTVSLIKTGSGTLALGPVNTYSGGTTIEDGILYIYKGTALGTGSITFKGGTLQSHGDWDSITNPLHVPEGKTGKIILANRTAVSGQLTGEGVLDIVITSSINRNTWDAPSASFSGRVNLSGGRNLEARFNGGNFNGFKNAHVHVDDAQISAHCYSPGNTFEIGAMSGGEKAVLSGNTYGGSVKYKVGAKNTSTTFAGTISDGNGKTHLIKTGTGTLTLTGTNTYSGNTTVENGKLVVDGSLKPSDVPTITVSSTARLGGKGEVTGNVTLLNGGARIELSDGEIGSLTINGNLELGDNSAIVLDIGDTVDQIIIKDGTLNRIGDVTISLNKINMPYDGTHIIISGAKLGSTQGFSLEESDFLKTAQLCVVDGDLAIKIKQTGTLSILR